MTKFVLIFTLRSRDLKGIGMVWGREKNNVMASNLRTIDEKSSALITLKCGLSIQNTSNLMCRGENKTVE